MNSKLTLYMRLVQCQYFNLFMLVEAEKCEILTVIPVKILNMEKSPDSPDIFQIFLFVLNCFNMK